MRSTAIEPDHLLLGLLREDPALFQVITGRDSSVVSEIKEEVKSTARFELASAATDALPLSRLGQQAVKSAERLRREFDQKHAGTQHLLLAIAKLPGPPDSKIRLFFG
ncbi:MAG TPA: Clp protease N-terminal domain-containing protein, partial [Blastocatellia bacterium]